MPPQVRYARSGEASVAYQVLGEHGPDLVFVPGFASHLDLAWEEPHLARFLRGLASFSRLIWFDKRGTGLSDPARPAPTLRAAGADVVAVLDAVGVRRAALFGVAVGAAICTSVALEQPDRVDRLVLWGAHARLLRAPGYPAGWTPEFLAGVLAGIDEGWADASGIEVMNPTLAGDERFRSWFARNARAAASPAQARELFELCAATDLRARLPELAVPTLVLQRVDDPWLSVEHSRWVAPRIPGARLVELPGVDHWPWIGDADACWSSSRPSSPAAAGIVGTARWPDRRHSPGGSGRSPRSPCRACPRRGSASVGHRRAHRRDPSGQRLRQARHPFPAGAGPAGRRVRPLTGAGSAQARVAAGRPGREPGDQPGEGGRAAQRQEMVVAGEGGDAAAAGSRVASRATRRRTTGGLSPPCTTRAGQRTAARL